MDILNPEHRTRLWKAIQAGNDRLAPFREKRRQLVEEYVGSEYPANGSNSRIGKRRRTLLSMIFTMVDTYTVAIAANRPRVMVTSKFPELKAFCRRYQTAIDNDIIEMRLGKTLQRIVQDALFSIGIAKVCLVAGDPVEVPNPDMPPEPSMFDSRETWGNYIAAQNAIPPNILVDPGRPFVEHVSLDDFVFDMSAKKWEDISFAAHYYRVTLESVQNDKRFDPKVVEKLGPETKWQYGQRSFGNRTDEITANRDDDDIDDMVTVMDLWLPRQRKWAVMSANHQELGPLFVEDWRGNADTSPFIPLTFCDTPDNIMPVSLVASVLPMHEGINQLGRKNLRQALDQKTLGVYKGNVQDANRVKHASDGELINLSQPESITAMRFGGVDNNTAGYNISLQGSFNEQAGNINALNGARASTGTVGQEQIVSQAAGNRPAKMQQRYAEFAELVLRQIGWMRFVDRTKRVPGQAYIPGLSQPVDASWTPEDREGDFEQYNLDVDQYSMPYQSPSEKLAVINQQLQAVFFPMLPVLQQQGMTLDFAELSSVIADLTNVNQFRDIVIAGDAPPPTDGPSGRPPSPNMPSSTTRNYVSQSGGKPPNPQAQAMQMMSDPQPMMGAK